MQASLKQLCARRTKMSSPHIITHNEAKSRQSSLYLFLSLKTPRTLRQGFKFGLHLFWSQYWYRVECKIVPVAVHWAHLYPAMHQPYCAQPLASEVDWLELIDCSFPARGVKATGNAQKTKAYLVHILQYIYIYIPTLFTKKQTNATIHIILGKKKRMLEQRYSPQCVISPTCMYTMPRKLQNYVR